MDGGVAADFDLSGKDGKQTYPTNTHTHTQASITCSFHSMHSHNSFHEHLVLN